MAAAGCGDGAGRGAGADASGPLRLVETLRIGTGVAADGSPGPTFGQIPDVAVAPSGGVWILDGATREVVRVDDAGREVRRLGGGAGDGPEVLQYPRRLHLRGDTLWVEDLGAARWSAWDTVGAFLHAFDAPSGVAGGNADWTAAGLVGVESRRDGGEVTRAAGRWLPGDGRLVRVDSFAAPPVPEPFALQTTFTRDGRPVSLAFPVPLAHQPSLRPHPSGDGWIRVPGGGAYRIEVLDVGGAVRTVVERDAAPVPVPEVERAVAVERLPPELRASEADRVPTTWPPFDRVVVGSDGRFWVVRRAPHAALDLFDAGGAYRGEAATEADLEGFWLHHAGRDALWGVQRDDAGRPVVLRFGIEGG